jgi:alkaline phosphatase D
MQLMFRIRSCSAARVSAAVLLGLLMVAGVAVSDRARAAGDAAVAAVAGTPKLGSAQLLVEPAVQRLAFGSCFKSQRDGHAIFDAVLDTRPDLFIYAGDTVYPQQETADPDLPSLRAAYAALAEVEAFSRLRRAVPVLPVWDDHDYGMNDGGADFPARAASEALFEDVWDLAADDPRRARDGVYHGLTLGPPGQRLQLILLDTRFFRSPWRVSSERGAPGRERYEPDDSAGKTLLGDLQWQWLAGQLEQPADLRVLVSTIQVLADGHGWERWGLLPRERERLFALLRDHDAVPTLLLSGDRHVAGIYQRDIGARAPLVEFTSSALNNTIPQPYRQRTLAEAGPRRMGALYGEANFGSLDIDWTGQRVALRLHAADGALQRELLWHFDGRIAEQPVSSAPD